MKRTLESPGFTIVELLIIIVVIGILAAITIVAYNSVQNRANDAAVQSDLGNAARQLEMYRADHGNYPIGDSYTVIAPQLQSAGIKISKSAYDTGGNANYTYLHNADGKVLPSLPSRDQVRFFATVQLAAAKRIAQVLAAAAATPPQG